MGIRRNQNRENIDMIRFVDIHQHVAYGIDDGARNIRSAKRLIDASYKAGVRVVVATPHVQPGVKAFGSDKYFDIIDELNRYCIEQKYEMKVLTGAEVLYTDATIRLLNAGDIPTLCNSRYVLVEWRNPVDIATFIQNIRDMTNAGYIPIIAHIERYRALWFREKFVQQLRSMYECRIQIDCDALVGKTHMFERMFTNKLLKLGLVDYIATDAHNVINRGVLLKEAYAAVKRKYGKRYARNLTYSNQREILGDELFGTIEATNNGH